jgi:hypothetical protein
MERALQSSKTVREAFGGYRTGCLAHGLMIFSPRLVLWDIYVSAGHKKEKTSFIANSFSGPLEWA